MEVKYSSFTVTISKPENEVIDISNFFKRNIWIIKNDDHILISKDEVSLWQVQALLSGKEDECKTALELVVENRKYNLKKVEELCR